MDVKTEIRKYIIDNFLYGEDDNTLDDEVSFLENGIIDSTGVLELVSFIQETYGIKVKDDELIPNNFDSLRKLETFVMNKREERTQERVDTVEAAAARIE
ncbi:MAG TPA: acyl carrier protein [Nitrospirota bacterium]|nr:acyl carrier protein [Nitrospirota bacterium]